MITTTLPAMIPCDESEATGWVREQTVREVPAKEIYGARKLALRKRRSDHGVNWPYLVGLKLLWEARHPKDPNAAREGAKLVYPYMPMTTVGSNPDFFTGDATGEQWDAFGRAFLEADAMKDNRFQVPLMINGVLEGCSPAIYVPIDSRISEKRVMFCRTFAAAAAFKMFYNGLGVCPHCLVMFLKTRPKQVCCSEAHRKAHNVVRWRARQHEEARKP